MGISEANKIKNIQAGVKISTCQHSSSEQFLDRAFRVKSIYELPLFFKLVESSTSFSSSCYCFEQPYKFSTQLNNVSSNIAV